MGPSSKDHLCKLLGHLIDELQSTRIVLQRLDGRIARRDDEHVEDIERLHKRVSETERDVRKLLANGDAAK